MTPAAPPQDQAICFYRAALVAARRLDQDSDHHVLDPDADAAWRAYGSDLPAAVRCDLVLRNFAMLYPAAFAPGPVFRLPGWYDDDPWGTGFERPPAKVVEGLFAVRAAPASAADALAQAIAAWGIGGAAGEAHLSDRVSPTTNVIAAGACAVAAVARAFASSERLSARAQVIVVGDRPEGRHILGIACALRREAGVPLFADLRRPDEAAAAWADREKQRLGVARAGLCVISKDTDAADVEAARALAAALGADETIEIAGA